MLVYHRPLYRFGYKLIVNSKILCKNKRIIMQMIETQIVA